TWSAPEKGRSHGRSRRLIDACLHPSQWNVHAGRVATKTRKHEIPFVCFVISCFRGRLWISRRQRHATRSSEESPLFGDIDRAQRPARRIEGGQLVSSSKPDVLTVIRDAMHVVGTRKGPVLTDDLGG